MADFKLSTQEIELGIKSLLNFKKPDSHSASNIAIPPNSENPTQLNDGTETKPEKPTVAATEASSESPVDRKEKHQDDGSKKTRKRRSKVMDSNGQESENQVLSEATFKSLSALKASISNNELTSSVSYVATGEKEVRKILKAKRQARKSQSDEGVASDKKQEQDGEGSEEKVEDKVVGEAVKKFWDMPVKKEKKKKAKKKRAQELKALLKKEDENVSESQPKPKEKKETEKRETDKKPTEKSETDKKPTEKRETDKKPTEKKETNKKSKSIVNKEEHTQPQVKKVVSQEATQVQSQADLLKKLEEDGIYPLKKKSTRFVQAKFFCRLCDYHMDTPPDCDRHMKDNRHKRRIEINKIETRLEKMPVVREDQVEAIDRLAEDILLQHALQKEDLDYRVKVTADLEKFLRKTQPEVSVVLYGSSQTGIALKDCDVNMDLLVKGDTSQATALTKALKVMKDSGQYIRLKERLLLKLSKL